MRAVSRALESASSEPLWRLACRGVPVTTIGYNHREFSQSTRNDGERAPPHVLAKWHTSSTRPSGCRTVVHMHGLRWHGTSEVRHARRVQRQPFGATRSLNAHSWNYE